MKTILSFLFVFISLNSFCQNKEILELWLGKVPGEQELKHEARLYPDTSNHVIRLTDVTDPILTVYKPQKDTNLHAGIIISPGGGNKYLAVNLEGQEIASWLNELGYTAFVLQYRVPMKQKGALQDIQRAVRIVRNGAKQWGLDADKIGVMGFSAGGNLSARASTEYRQKTYLPVDGADSLSCRPDFCLLIYPGSLSTGKEHHELIPDLIIDKNIPPMFVFVASDDPYGVPLSLAYELKKVKVPFEFHIVAKGGHGYGLRKGNPAANEWPLLAEKWLKSQPGNLSGK